MRIQDPSLLTGPPMASLKTARGRNRDATPGSIRGGCDPMTPSRIPDGDFEQAPLAERIAGVYWLRVRDTGLGRGQAAGSRGGLGRQIAQ